MSETESQAAPFPAPPVLKAGAELAGQLCSICQTTVIAGESVVACPCCALPFHSECWDENRGCSAYGCKAAPPTIKPKQDAQPLSNAWGDEKPCPKCNKKIKAQALKCRFCGAVFGSRDVISKEEYASREYEGNEYAAARNKVMLLFFLSVAGCIAPLGVILVGILISHKELMGIDYRRLSPTLKALLWCAFGVGLSLILMMILLAAFDS
ncbi:MAG: hypothetical protein M5U26_22620 [Planctomycetota bacterium]|nr:hypothetical protein [Planctomycetota bacterium]